MHRCPHKLATQEYRDVISAAVLVELGILPDGGGWQDQSATFVRAFPIVMQEINHWRNVVASIASKPKKK